MIIVCLYNFFTVCVFASWIYDKKDDILTKVLNIFGAFYLGWLVTPIIIGRVIKKIIKIDLW